MSYDECKWWCQTGVGFPTIGAPGGNGYIQGMRWQCPCGRSWRVRGDEWRQESRFRTWTMDRYWWFFHPEYMDRVWSVWYRIIH